MINLLPPKQKEELLREEKWKLTSIFGIILLFSLLFFSLALFFIQTYISSELETWKIIFEIEEKKFKTPEIQDFQKKIVVLNQNLSKLDSFYQEQIDLTEVLEKISQILPPGVYLNNLSWQKEISQMGLSGFAPKREDLFTLRENLEKEKDFEEIYFPSSNWVKPKDIDFYVAFKIKSLK